MEERQKKNYGGSKKDKKLTGTNESESGGQVVTVLLTMRVDTP